MAAVTQPQGSDAALGLVNVSPASQVEQAKSAPFVDSQLNGGPPQALANIGAGLHAHLAANVAAEGVGININSSG